MAPKEMSDYERQRLENIRRNDEMMASLKLHAIATQLSASSKRQRAETKSYKVSPNKKPKTETPVIIRRSLRTRGLPPEARGVDDDLVDSDAKMSKTPSPSKSSPRNHLGPISMQDAYCGTGSGRDLIETIVGFRNREDKLSFPDGVELGGNNLSNDKNSSDPVEEVDGFPHTLVRSRVNGERSCLDLCYLTLNPENIARVIPGRITNVQFLPCTNSKMIVAGNKFGNIGFWNLDSKAEEDDGIFLYHPHSGPISGISIHPHCTSKIFTSCYDGFIRLMDAEKEAFDLVYSSNETIFSLYQRPSDVKCLYFGEGRGGLSNWDERIGCCSTKWTLHDDRINSIDFNPENPNLMLTSSSDGKVCIWDLRNIKADKPKTLKIFSHKRASHSAYFSPSGRSIATTSFDDTVGILSGVNFEQTSMVGHNNQTGRWISSFRAIWGWDDSYVFIGNMKRGVDVISTAQAKAVFTLQSPHITAIPCRFATHPRNVGMLAGATSGGQVYVWTLG